MEAETLFGCLPGAKASGATPIRFRRGFRTALRADEYCPFHQHPAIELVYHPVGRGVTRLQSVPEEVIRYRSGTVVIYPAGCPHDQRMEADGTDCCLQFSLEPGGMAALPHAVVFHEVEDAYLQREIEALSRSGAILDEAEQAVLNLRVTALLLALWTSRKPPASARRGEAPDRPPAVRRVEDAKRYLSRHLAEADAPEQAARQLGISYDHLRHLFARHEGQTLATWLRDLRVKRVCELLRFSPLPLKAIASECGFQNSRYLCTVFRKQMGVSPGRFRTSRGETPWRK